MQIEISSKGSFQSTEDWLTRLRSRTPTSALNEIGRAGVAALQRATPVGPTGQTAAGWSYKVEHWWNGSGVSFYNNSHPETPASVPILIQYGHGTKNGGYVPGYDFINPALRGIFQQGTDKLVKEMMK